MKRILLFLSAGAAFVQCKKDDDKNQAEIDHRIITEYITDNGLDAQNIG